MPFCIRRAPLFCGTELAVQLHLYEEKVTKEIVMGRVQIYSLYSKMRYITNTDVKCKKDERKQICTRR
jgi:hypothetical protein